MKVFTIPPHDEIVAARLRRRIEKLVKQRDKLRNECLHQAEVINSVPFLMSRRNNWEEWKRMVAENKQLELRVKEQSLLIAKLVNEPR